MIRRSRGAIQIVDRPALEEAACDCYGHVAKVMEELDVQPQATAG